MRKLSILASVAAFGCMAFVGTGSALAQLTVESCESGNTNCQTTTVGATFEASGPVQLSGSGLTNSCTMAVSGEVTGNPDGSSNLTADINSATFSSCNVCPTVANNLPWTLSLPDAGPLSGGKISTNARVTLSCPIIGTCVYDNAGDTLTGTWVNGANPPLSGVTLGGTMSRVSGAFCPATGNITGTVTLTDVDDPNHPGANNLLIQ